MRPSAPLSQHLATTALMTAVALAACSPVAPVTTPGPVDTTAPDARAALRILADSLVSQPAFRNAHWGVLIVDPARGDTLYSHNAGKLFMPASNQKLITGAVALARLGPDYRFRTEVATVSPVGDSPALLGGTLRGDLVVTGYGDPTVSDHAVGDAMAPLHAMADSLIAHGVRRINGRLLAGADNLPGPPLGFGWAWDDLPYPYSAGVDELLFNEGFAEIVVRGGATAGAPPTAVTRPARGFPVVRIAATTVARDTTLEEPELDVATAPDGLGAVVTGTIAAGDSAVLRLAFRDQTAAYLAALGEALADRGIRVDGRGDTPADGVVARAGSPLFTVLSPPLRDVMPLLQKPSQNQIAELLLRAVGRELTGVGSADSGQAVVERQLLAWGAQPDGFVIRDGSGLSRHDYLTPATIIRVLDVMTRDPSFQLYYDALPIAGVDGTIASRMKGTPAAGNVHAKTGYIDRARSLSGYVTTADGQRLLFSILANNWTTSVRDVELVQDTIAAMLAGMTLRAPAAAGSP
ncbi:MAG: D-alanyl-D-alanine carboxypeptidase/D-alanyl-D-alanine endopeptidase [Gemmatimonadaceae bacterium]